MKMTFIGLLEGHPSLSNEVPLLIFDAGKVVLEFGIVPHVRVFAPHEQD